MTGPDLRDVSRRELMAAAGALGAGIAAPAVAQPGGRRRPAPAGFLWGTAISAYQSEGNNTNSDAWLMENLKPSISRNARATPVTAIIATKRISRSPPGLGSTATGWGSNGRGSSRARGVSRTPSSIIMRGCSRHAARRTRAAW